MGLLDGLGDMLKGLFGQADQAGGLPAVINNILGQTHTRISMGWLPRCKRAG